MTETTTTPAQDIEATCRQCWPDALATMDTRFRLPMRVKAMVRDLVGHVGGDPDPVQREAIRAAARVRLRLGELEAKRLGDGLSEREAWEAQRLEGVLGRHLAKLQPPKQTRRRPRLMDGWRPGA